MGDPADASEPDLPLVSGTTAAAARAAGHPTRVVPAGVPDDHYAHVTIAVKERLRLGEGGDVITIEQSYTVAWISPDDWVRLVTRAIVPA